MAHLDIHVGKLKKNAFRYSKVRGETASRIRIPGGVIDSASMQRVVEIAEKYGTGVINITNRQGIEIPGIKLEDMDKWTEGESPFGLPKTRVYRVVLKKKKKAKTEEPAAADAKAKK